jgi:hypothetical protein
MLILRDIYLRFAIAESHGDFIRVQIDAIARRMSIHDRQMRGLAAFSLGIGSKFALAFGTPVEGDRRHLCAFTSKLSINGRGDYAGRVSNGTLPA